jgi:hypothetical protein
MRARRLKRTVTVGLSGEDPPVVSVGSVMVLRRFDWSPESLWRYGVRPYSIGSRVREESDVDIEMRWRFRVVSSK